MHRLLAFLLPLAFVAPPAAEEAGAGGEPGTPTEPDRPSDPNEPPETGDTEPAPEATEPLRIAPGKPAPTVLDHTLPCGLRVLVAQDESLPVAAITLAVEVGTEDDPAERKGLVHALAFHLQQGNRVLRPGEAIATVQDVGGHASLAVGPRQVRFESLVPVSALDRVLWVESQRLRAPTVNHTLWLKSLGYAKSDRRPRPPIPRQGQAGAWGVEALSIDHRRLGKGLGDMSDADVSEAIGRLFDLRHATLVIVSPREPAKVAARVDALFADLPAKPRAARPLSMPATAPKPEVEGPRNATDTLVWPLSVDPGERAWARAICATLNRQAAAEDDPPGRVRCLVMDDARRPVVAIRASGKELDDPPALVRRRLDRIADGGNRELLETQLERQRRSLIRLQGSPRDLAKALSATEPVGPGGDVRHRRSSLLGLDAIEDVDKAAGRVRAVFAPERAVRLVAPPSTPEGG